MARPRPPSAAREPLRIVVANRGQTTATGLTVEDRFDPGLEHEVKKDVIERTLPDLPPGRDVSLRVTFRVAQPGRLCHTVQILSGRRVLDKKESWVTGVPAPGGQSESPPGPPRFPLPGQPPAHEEPILPPPGLSVTVTGLHNAVTAGEEMTYYVAVKNHGSVPEHQVALSATVPAAMALAPLGTSSLPLRKVYLRQPRRHLRADRKGRSRRDPHLLHPRAGPAARRLPLQGGTKRPRTGPAAPR